MSGVDQVYRDKVLEYWTLSRKWNRQDREPITFGDLIGALGKLGDRSFHNQRLQDLVFDLLDRVERNWRCRKRKPTNNVVPFPTKPVDWSIYDEYKPWPPMEAWQKQILDNLNGLHPTNPCTEVPLPQHGTATGRWSSGKSLLNLVGQPLTVGISNKITGKKIEFMILDDPIMDADYFNKDKSGK